MLDVPDAASRGDVVMVLLPDEKQAEIWNAEIADGIADGDLLMFAHGFSIHFGQIEPPAGVDVGMVAPKGPGHLRAAGARCEPSPGARRAAGAHRRGAADSPGHRRAR